MRVAKPPSPPVVFKTTVKRQEVALEKPPPKKPTRFTETAQETGTIATERKEIKLHGFAIDFDHPNCVVKRPVPKITRPTQRETGATETGKPATDCIKTTKPEPVKIKVWPPGRTL